MPDANTPYSFAVVAVNANNRTSAPSQRSAAVVPCAVGHTTPPDRPVTPTATAVPYGVLLQWQPMTPSACWAGPVAAWNVSYTTTIAGHATVEVVLLPDTANASGIRPGLDCVAPVCAVTAEVRTMVEGGVVHVSACCACGRWLDGAGRGL